MISIEIDICFYIALSKGSAMEVDIMGRTGAVIFIFVLIGIVITAGIVANRTKAKELAREFPDGKHLLDFFRIDILSVYPVKVSEEFGVVLACAGEEGDSVRRYKDIYLPHKPSGDDSSYLLVDGGRVILLLSEVDLGKIEEIRLLRIGCSI